MDPIWVTTYNSEIFNKIYIKSKKLSLNKISLNIEGSEKRQDLFVTLTML